MYSLNGKPDSVDNVISPSETFKGNRIDILVKDDREGDGDLKDHETAGSDSEWKAGG